MKSLHYWTIVTLGRTELARWELILFQKFSTPKVLDLVMSDHIHWTEIYPKFLKICVLAPKDYLRPYVVHVTPQKNVTFFSAPSPNLKFIEMLHLELSSNFGQHNLNKLTKENNLREICFFGQRVKIMDLTTFYWTVGKTEFWCIFSCLMYK